MHIEVKQLVLMKSNVQKVITWGNKGRRTLHPWGTLHTFRLDTSTERATSHTQTNCFAGG